jgi:hypothetical protein
VPIYTVVCLPPTTVGKPGSVSALDFAIKLQIGASVHPDRKSARKTSQATLKASSSVEAKVLPAGSAKTDEFVQILTERVSGLDWTLSQLAGENRDQAKDIQDLSARVRMLELANRPQPKPELEFSLQSSSTPSANIPRRVQAHLQTPSSSLGTSTSFDTSRQSFHTLNDTPDLYRRYVAPIDVYRDSEDNDKENRHF